VRYAHTQFAVEWVVPPESSGAALAAVALAAVARTGMATAALGLVLGGPSSARVILPFSRCSVAFALRLFN